MASITLKHVKKIYPYVEPKKSKKKGADEPIPENEINLLITDEGIQAVADFNMEIADKEFIVLVGPSGCGKSTTLRMIAGLEEITAGEIYIDDVLVNDIPPKDRDVSMVFQNYALYPHMTVYQNMAFSLKLHKYPKAVIDQRVREAADILAITPYLHRKPKSLSGGQRQRVAIGRAIVRTPKVFLMDEPLSNLDAKLRSQMRAQIIKLRQSLNTTFVYVTHDQTEAMTLGDRIVVMKDGIVQQIGTPQEVFEKPANQFVASFIGTPQMNFFPARLVQDENGSYAVDFEQLHVTLSDIRQQHLRDAGVSPQEIILGIRPEHFILCSAQQGVLTSTVEMCELMGSSAYLHVNLHGRDTVIVARSVDSNDTLHHFTAGQTVFFTFGGNLLHLFSAENGKNLED